MRVTLPASRLAGFASLLLLAGCLTSEGLLFDETNARAAALEAGAWRACETDSAPSDAAPAEDCRDVTLTRDETGLYTFAAAGEDEKTFARFRKTGARTFSAQLWGEDDDDPFYFLVTKKGEHAVFSMIDCEKLPASYKQRYVAKGELVVEDESTCIAKTVRVVDAAARAWAKTDAAKTGSRIIYTRL